MSAVAGDYVAPHASQFDGSPYEDANCTPDAGANGANTTSGGVLHLTGGKVRSLVKRSEETSPGTPGWSLPDLELAMDRVGVAVAEFLNRGGDGWAALIACLDNRQAVVCQGDSDQFGNGTCSGAFNGDHAITIFPAMRIKNGLRQRWIADGICRKGRWEYEYILRRYAVKLNPRIQFGHFTHAVPRAALTPLQALVNRVTFLRVHEPAAARRWRNAHKVPAHETTAKRTARLTAEATYLTKARIVRLARDVKSLRRRHPAAAKAYRAKHPIPATETLRQRDARLTAEIKALRKASH